MSRRLRGRPRRGGSRRALVAGCALAAVLGGAVSAGCSADDGDAGEASTAADGPGKGGDDTRAAGDAATPDPPEPREEPPQQFSEEGFRVPSDAKGSLGDVEVGQGVAEPEEDSGSGGDGDDAEGENGDGGDGGGDAVETVTFDLGTEELPEYHVQYVDQVRAHPDGEAIDIAGDAYVEVGFELTDVNEDGKLAIPPNSRPDQPLVKETMLVRNVGGELRFVIGLSEKTEFRAHQDGSALVVQLRTE